MITITQILVIIFGVIMFFITLNHFRKKKLNQIGFFIWASVWIILVVSILLFDFVSRLANLILNIHVFDFFVLGAIILIFVLIFLLNSSINENRKKIDEVVEEIASRDAKKKK